MQDRQEFRMISIEKVKLSNMPSNLSAFGPKVKKKLKNYKIILRFFDQNHYGKVTF